ncbi:MAG TPA: hypothetical protein VHM91_19485, partial [Verrucomicrobiales bacterium]|nr:hypothetical protein [Verrucomicrobiales bacterium]
MRYLPAVLLTLFSCAAGAAEDGGYLISAWRMDDGLPPLVSPVLTEAPEGYLWTRAEAGPVRFDGIRFTVFSSSLTGWPQGIKISKLTADTHQGLWVVLRDRSLWRERGGIWTRYAAMSDTEHIVSMVPARRSRGIVAGTTQGRLLRCTDDPPSVTELMPRQPGFIGWLDACDAEGGIWFAANGGSRRWINGKVEHIKYPAEENKDDFIFPYTDGTMWIIGPDYVARWSDGAFQKLPPISGLAPQRLAGILPAPPHGVWASTKDRLYFLPEGASKWDGPWPWATRAEQRQLTNLADVNGHHWIATYGFGFLHVSPEGTQIPERLPPDLAGNRILNFIEDRERNIWAVAEGSGLVRLQTKRFEVHRAGAGLSDPEVMAVAEDSSGTLWAGSRAGGVDILKKGLWSHVTLPPGDEPAAAVTSLLPRKGKGILAGTESRGVWEQTGSNWSPLGSSKVAA